MGSSFGDWYTINNPTFEIRTFLASSGKSCSNCASSGDINPDHVGINAVHRGCDFLVDSLLFRIYFITVMI